MTNRAKVQLANTNRVVTIDLDATEGAVFGVNLRYADGSLVKLSDFTASGGSASGLTLGTAYSLFVPQSRTVSTVSPLAGGGALSANLTITTSLSTDRLLGRDTAGTGVAEQITVGGGIEFTGAGGIQTSAFTGDVTKTAGGTVQTIANDAVTFAKMQNITSLRLIGRTTAAAGDPEEISVGVGLVFSGGSLSASAGGANPPMVTFAVHPPEPQLCYFY